MGAGRPAPAPPRAEIPGLDPDKDVEITAEDHVLTLRAELGRETTEKRRTEFRPGTFARSVRLRAGAQGDRRPPSTRTVL
ncbi:Hsp20/alpha crystallin family protein [Streptomyces sp. NBC_00289]|uniref:Hsp20/alpha crystallin family protein n=1 Tax=Streptomyces sp. NBC_00289 TaxID=2975703 RepID=UPI00352D6845